MSGWRAIVVGTVVILLALTNQVRPLNILAYALGAVLVLSALWGWGSLRGIQYSRRVSATRAQVGEIFEDRITVRNTSWLPRIWLEVRDRSSLPGHQVGRVIDLGPNRARTWLIRTRCSRRGQYLIGPTMLAAADPLGLFPNARPIQWMRRLLVYPATYPLPTFTLPPSSQLGGSFRRSRPSQSTPHASEVRRYVPGDPLKHIHWASTARTRELMVKEFDEDPASDVWIFLDLESAAQRGEGDDSTEEYAVSAAASIAKHLLDENRLVGLIATGRHHTIVSADRGERQLTRILEELAVVRADGSTPIRDVLAAESYRCRRGMAAVVITPSTEENWVDSLQQLRFQRVSAAAIVLEASTFGQADSSLMVMARLVGGTVPRYLLKRGTPITEALVGDGVALSPAFSPFVR